MKSDRIIIIGAGDTDTLKLKEIIENAITDPKLLYIPVAKHSPFEAPPIPIVSHVQYQDIKSGRENRRERRALKRKNKR
jgi:hypothetical protein